MCLIPSYFCKNKAKFAHVFDIIKKYSLIFFSSVVIRLLQRVQPDPASAGQGEQKVPDIQGGFGGQVQGLPRVYRVAQRRRDGECLLLSEFP